MTRNTIDFFLIPSMRNRPFALVIDMSYTYTRPPTFLSQRFLQLSQYVIDGYDRRKASEIFMAPSTLMPDWTRITKPTRHATSTCFQIGLS
jgi:hypothetical protein